MATGFTSAGTRTQGTGMLGGRGAPRPGESCMVKSLQRWGLRIFFLTGINKIAEHSVQLAAAKEASCVVFLTDKPGPISVMRINIY